MAISQIQMDLGDGSMDLSQIQMDLEKDLWI